MPPPPILGPGPTAPPSLPPATPAQPSPSVSKGAGGATADLCSWLPAGPLKTVGSTTIEPITEVDSFERSTVGIVAKCVKAYSSPPDLTLAVYRYGSVDKATRALSRDPQGVVKKPAWAEERSASYGDFGIEEWERAKSQGESRYYGLSFRRGCYVFQGSDRVALGDRLTGEPVPSQTIDSIRSAAAQVDAKLRALPPCGSSAPPTGTTGSPTTVRVKDPTTGSWVTWLLVPGIGLVLYAAAKLGSKKPQETPATPNTPTEKPNKPENASTANVKPQPANKPQEDPREYELDIRTQDDRTSLNADGEDILWVYAQVRCNKPEINTEALTAGLTFTAEGADAKWLNLGTPQRTNGFKTVPVRAWPPSQEAQLSEGKGTVVVSAMIEGNKIDGPVKLDLETKYVMEFV